ncbi:MAG: ribonuclease III [bacterium]
MNELEERLGYRFRNPALLKTALTHSSYANENKGEGECNERLEFLGDSILGFLVARHLYRTRPGVAEGKMTRLRADMVCEKSLNEVAVRLTLGEQLLLGKGEELGGGRQRPSIRADAVEAVLAAIYLDGGLEEAERFVYAQIINRFEHGEKAPIGDYKTALQEVVQRTNGNVLTYREVGESGPDHDKLFESAALLNGRELARGKGHTKKEAEQAAARLALEALQ